MQSDRTGFDSQVRGWLRELQSGTKISLVYVLICKMGENLLIELEGFLSGTNSITQINHRAQLLTQQCSVDGMPF